MLFGSKKSKRPRDPPQVTPQAAPVKPTKTPSQRRLIVTVTRTDIMASIAEGTAASNNLLNALRLVNPDSTQVQDNAEITEIYTKAKEQQIEIIKNARRCTEDDLMGTLLEVNERLVSALGLYAEMVQKADIKKAISISRHDSSWTPSSMPIVNNGDSYIPPWVAGSSGPSGSGSTSFSFQKEKQQILRTIAETSQAAINLNNALKLVDLERTSVQADVKVQACWDKASEMRKKIVGYIELVEDEDMIGTLLETNERLSDALTMYDKLSDPDADAVELRQELDQSGQLRFQHFSLDSLHSRPLPSSSRPLSTHTSSSPALTTFSSSPSASPALRASSYPTTPHATASAPILSVERSSSPPPPSYSEVMSTNPELSFESGSMALASHSESSTSRRRSPNLEEIAPNGEHVLTYNYETDEDPFADPPEHGLQ